MRRVGQERETILKYLLGWKGYLLLAIASLAIGTFSGWSIQGMRKDAVITGMRLEQANEKAETAQAQLQGFVANADKINRAATVFTKVNRDLSTFLAQSQKDFNNAPPLPPDCKPDAYRVRRLESVIDKANQAIVGQQPSD